MIQAMIPDEGISRSEQARASSAHARINIPLNLENWQSLPEPLQNDLLWFHQHCLDEGLTLEAAGEAIGYDKSTVFRVLKGNYEGAWDRIQSAIQSYRKLFLERGKITHQEFVKNGIAKRVWGALNYALANESMTLITGESRMGKTASARAWAEANNHGRSVFVIAPAYGGTKALLRAIAKAVGVNKAYNSLDMHAAILRAFNRNRILIIDEAHRLLPGDRRSNPVNIEVVRDIHDQSGCAVALIATGRFDTELKKGNYMFEQLIGRIGAPLTLRPKVPRKDVDPIVRQFISRPSESVLDDCERLANQPGRLGVMVETLRIASRMASKAGERTNTKHFEDARAYREQMLGSTASHTK